MSEFSKAMKNKIGKAFIKNEKKLECISNGDVTDELRDLSVDKFRNNCQEYKKFRSILNFKIFLKYDLPLITMLVGVPFALKTDKSAEMVPYYHLEQVMLCDDKLVRDVDDNNYIVLPDGKEIDGDYIEIDNVNDMVQYQVKSGTRSAIVTVGLDEEGKMSVVDSLVGNFFDKNSDVFDDIESTTLDQKYQELVEDIGDFVINSDSVSSTTKKEIKKLLESEKATIITTVAEYVEAGQIELIDTDGYWLGKVVLREGIFLLVAVMFEFLASALLKADEIKRLTNDGEDVEYGDGYYTWKVKPFSTIKNAKEAFVRADNIRVSKIKRLVKSSLSEESQKYFDK